MSRAGDLVRGVLRRIRSRSSSPRASEEAGRSDSFASGETEPVAEDPLEVELPVPGSLLVDIREPGEYAGGVAEGAMLLPMNLVPHHLHELPRDRALTLYCAAGARSFGVAHWLREQGYAQAYSLAGGVGVFDAVGHGVRPPAGVLPGTRVKVPADAFAEGARVGVELWGEVIEQVGPRLRVLVHDAQGYPVRVEIDAL